LRSALDLAARDTGGLAGRVLVDCTNPVARDAAGFQISPPPEGFVAAALAAAFRRTRVVTGFDVFGADTAPASPAPLFRGE
jgi:predicted dinucleotide-binding enzyme